MKKGLTGATGNFYVDLHEYREMIFVNKVLKKQDIFIDIGANIGSYSIIAGSRCNNVYSFEPLPTTFNILKKNIVFNDFENKINAFNIGLSFEKNKLKFTNDLDTVNHVALDNSSNFSEVSVDKLDNIIELKDKDYFLKIDVEGFELNVIKGATKLLSSGNIFAILIETNDSTEKYGFNKSEIFSFLKKYNYEPFDYDYSSNKITEYKDDDNTIFILDKDFVNNRLNNTKWKV